MNALNDLLVRLSQLGRRLEVLETLDVPPVVARYTTNAGQSLSGGPMTIINFEDLVLDTYNAVTVGASWKFTAPIGGYYHVEAFILLTSATGWATGDTLQMELYKGGSAYSQLFYEDDVNLSASSIMRQAKGSDVIYLAAGNYIDIRVAQDSGGSISLYNNGLYNHVAVHKL